MAVNKTKELPEDERLVGTPNYLAPEVLIKGHSIDSSLDVWAFGCILYNMVKGSPPFDVDFNFLTFFSRMMLR